MPGAESTRPGPASAAAGAYTEYAAPAALAAHVECFWSRAPQLPSSSVDSPTHRVLPDGCVDIIFGFEGPQEWPRTAAAVGAMTRPLVFRDASDRTYLGARFRPGVARAVLGLPASELTDERVPLADVWPDATRVFDSLGHASDSVGRIRRLSAEIARRLLGAAAGPPAAVIAARERIVMARGDISISALAAELGITRQHLARAFAEHVGLSPKLLARVVRARNVIDRARRGRDVDWTFVALEAGYYDQSHLIAEIKELTGLPPSAWVGRAAD